MKAITLKFAIKFGAAAFLVCGGFSAQGEDRTVTNAQGLVEALEALNSGSASGNTIYLEPGNYDVSPYNMANWGSSGKTSTFAKHIALANVTVSGMTDNPRDTVIYGNGTDGIAHCYAAGFRHLTISNGCDSTATEDRGGGVNSGTHSNVIVTCCSSGALGVVRRAARGTTARSSATARRLMAAAWLSAPGTTVTSSAITRRSSAVDATIKPFSMIAG